MGAVPRTLRPRLRHRVRGFLGGAVLPDPGEGELRRGPSGWYLVLAFALCVGGFASGIAFIGQGIHLDFDLFGDDWGVEFRALLETMPQPPRADAPGSVEVEIRVPGEYGIYADRSVPLSLEVRLEGQRVPLTAHTPPPRSLPPMPMGEAEVTALGGFEAEVAGTYELTASWSGPTAPERVELVLWRVHFEDDPHFEAVKERLRGERPEAANSDADASTALGWLALVLLVAGVSLGVVTLVQRATA